MTCRFRPTCLLLATLMSALRGADQAAPGAAAEPAFSREHPRAIAFQTDWFPQAEHGGFYQALAKGYYAEAGLAVTLVSGGPGTSGTMKVARGDSDLGMNRSDNVIVSIVERNLPFLIVGAVTQHDYEALLVHADSPVHAFADLEGRTIIASPGQIWIDFLRMKFGLKFNVIPTGGGLGLFLPDRDAIQQCIYTNEPFIAQQQGVKVRTLALADSGYDVPTVIYCRRDFAHDNPAATRAFLAASLRGWRDFLEGDPAPAFAEIRKRNPNMSAEFLAFSRGEMLRHRVITGDSAQGEGIGRLSRARLKEVLGSLSDLKILSTPVGPGQVASWDFLPPEAK